MWRKRVELHRRPWTCKQTELLERTPTGGQGAGIIKQQQQQPCMRGQHSAAVRTNQFLDSVSGMRSSKHLLLAVVWACHLTRARARPDSEQTAGIGRGDGGWKGEAGVEVLVIHRKAQSGVYVVVAPEIEETKRVPSDPPCLIALC